MDCEHPDGDILGTCKICGDMVCGECFREIFNSMICGNHTELEDEGEWEMLGFYTSEGAMEERRYFLTDKGITSLVNEGDDEVIEVYVPAAEKEDAFEALTGASEDTHECPQCQVFYSAEIGTCPMCGVGPETQH